MKLGKLPVKTIGTSTFSWQLWVCELNVTSNCGGIWKIWCKNFDDKPYGHFVLGHCVHGSQRGWFSQVAMTTSLWGKEMNSLTLHHPCYWVLTLCMYVTHKTFVLF